LTGGLPVRCGPPEGSGAEQTIVATRLTPAISSYLGTFLAVFHFLSIIGRRGGETGHELVLSHPGCPSGRTPWIVHCQSLRPYRGAPDIQLVVEETSCFGSIAHLNRPFVAIINVGLRNDTFLASGCAIFAILHSKQA